MVPKIYAFLVCFSLLLQLKTTAQGITGSILINDGKTVTNAKDKRVDLAIIGRGATEMQISNNGSFIGARWEPLQPRYTGWKLAGEDGIKTVYAKFRDNNYNVSEVASATIELDRTPPINGDIIVDAGKDYTNDKNRFVALELPAQEAVQMRLSGRSDFLNAAWVPYKSALTRFRLLGLDGPKTVYVQYRDQAGNVTETYSDDIILDTQAPTEPKLRINKGDQYTTKSLVQIETKATGATEMQIRGSVDWIPYEESFEWELTPGDGEKAVFIRFADPAGNYSMVVSDRITVDTQPPLNGRIMINNGARYISEFNQLQLHIAASGADEMLISTTPNFTGATWTGYQSLVPSFPVEDSDGEKEIFIKFRDRAGNESEVYSTKVVLDQKPPTSSKIRIVSEGSTYDEELEATIMRNESNKVDLAIQAEGARYMMLSNASTFREASWQLYKPRVKDWELGGLQDGVKTVFVKFRDRAGNLTEPVFDKVIIDNQPPVDTKIAIEKNEKYVTAKDKSATINLFARGASEMMLSNEPTFQTAVYEPYAERKKWILSGDDGAKSVFARFKDKAGNVSDPIHDEVVLDRLAPYNIKLTINKGAETTNHPDKIVVLNPSATDAVAMQLSSSTSFTKVRWVPYSNKNNNWQLPGEDGKKTVYVRFRDAAGNISDVTSASITLDRTPPLIGSVKINGGDRITNNADKSIVLEIEAKDVTEMMISNRFDFKDGNWEAYATKREWTLTGPDGLKTVYIKFRDRIGNVSRVASARIGVDRQAPREGRIQINGGAKFATNINGYVDLKLYALDAKEMRIAQDPALENYEWQPYEYIIEDYLLKGDDGEKKVYVQFRDRAGNETTPIVASIVLDRQSPYDETLVINNGEKYTNNTSNQVQLDIAATEAVEMLIGNNQYFRGRSKWQPYATQARWVLDGSDGEKTVHIKFRDRAGNQSEPITSTIILDTQAPTARYMKINGNETLTDDTKVLLTIKAEGASFMMVSNYPDFSGSIWEDYKEQRTWDMLPGEGLKKVYIKFKDNAQNETPSKFSTITLENRNPVEAGLGN